MVYGELYPPNLFIGDAVLMGDLVGRVKRVLKKDKGKPMSMLHLEARSLDYPINRDVVWHLDQPMPPDLLDPVPYINKQLKE